MSINKKIIKAVIKRQYNIITHEERQIRIKLSMETDNNLPVGVFDGLYNRIEQHLNIIIDAQNKIVLIQQLGNPE
tara:strand:+ start:54 stop:278 length:225 start_codon:yes stop_codon:yes gene_type:complete